VKLSVVGCGHLGATHAACLASLGHDVIGVDIDQAKVDLLNSGRGWFHEPGLDPMLAACVEGGRLRFTTDFAEAGEFAAVHFIGVATPGHADGSYDLAQLRAAVSSLVPHLRGDCLIIGKSTVPPGTAAALQAMVDEMTRPGPGQVEIAWNPEFLREGCAVADTLRPNRIVVGAASAAAADTIREIYRRQTDAGVPLLVIDLATAELAKGAANALLATKISFVNAMADICAAIGGDISALATSLGLDPRIGPAFLTAGLGYGGACLPKDVRGLGTFAGEVGALGAAALLGAVDAINSARIAQAVSLVKEAVGEIAGRRIAVWGAAFKAGTDDVRDSAGLLVADHLRALGARVMVYDPAGSGGALVTFPALGYADSAIRAAADADAIVVVTAWPEFAQADAAEVARVVGDPTVVDVCQGIDLAAWQEAGWRVSSLTGVPASLPRDHSASSVALAAGLRSARDASRRLPAPRRARCRRPRGPA
jgi:UDPglucose 6-dehydrogenase